MSDEQKTQIVYSLPEAAKALRISVRKIYTLIGAKELKTFTIGDRRLVSHHALIDYIRQCEEAG